jgi:CHAD domain-containing protein
MTSVKVTLPPDRATLQLNPQGRSDVALRQILLGELDIMELNEACLRQQYDVECLHDFRVAVRRSRIILSRIADVFPAADVRRFTARLCELSEMTGPCRDLDVMLQHWQEYAIENDAGYQLVYDYLLQQSNKARSEVMTTLSGQQYVEFKDNWRDYLSRQPAVTRMQNAKSPLSLLASMTLKPVIIKFVKRLGNIRHSSSDDKLHKLRIVSKRLRYLLDYFLFTDSGPANAVLIPELKKLQEVLGVNQDLCVQKSMIAAIRNQMTEAGLMSVDVHHVLQDIKKSLTKRAAKQRVQVFKAIKRFLRSDVLPDVRQVD